MPVIFSNPAIYIFLIRVAKRLFYIVCKGSLVQRLYTRQDKIICFNFIFKVLIIGGRDLRKCTKYIVENVKLEEFEICSISFYLKRQRKYND